MKKLLILLTLWTTFVNANTIETYTNSRFDFSIDYPSDILVNKSFPTNGDGVWLTNKSKTVTLTPSGSYMTVSENIEEAYKLQNQWKNEDKNIELIYKAQKENWFVFSGYNHKNKSIFYEKRFCYVDDKNVSVLVGYSFEYPIKEKEKYNKWIKVFNESFVYPHIKSENDSFYTQTKEEKVISEGEQGVEVLLNSPDDYNVTVGDCGGFMMQLVINDYVLQTAQIPDLIEWRMDNKKKIIGAIVRTYELIWDEKTGIFEGKYSSVLNVLSFKDEVELLGKTSSNVEARQLLDKEKR